MGRLSLLLVVVCVVLQAACSVADEPNVGTPPTAAPEPAPAAATGSSTTTVAPSVGLIRIGPASYDLAFTCFAPGAGEILAVGAGTDVNGRPVDAYVQAFLGEPFVGLVVGEGSDAVRFEPRVDRVLDFTVADDVVRFDGVDFVSGLDLDTGVFTPAGEGSVVVECRSYDDEPPPSVFG